MSTTTKAKESSDYDPGGISSQKDGLAVDALPGNAERELETAVVENNTATMDESAVKSSDPVPKKSFCKKLIQMFSLTQEGATPVNWKILFLVVGGLFGSCYSITFLFPFLPDMVLFFGYKEEEKGYFVGLIASAMFAGRIFGSYFWGWLSDIKGRRPVILICLVFIMITNLVFGFSVNIYMAVSCRFISGLCNGLVGSCKTVLYEISDNTNQALGMSAMSMAWGSGIIIGPLLSGYLAEPAIKYPHVFSETGAFGKFPYLLPSLVAALMCVVPLIVLAIFLPETLNTRNNKELLTVEVEETKREESASLLNRDQSLSTSHLQGPHKPLVNRQLSKVKQNDLHLSNPSQLNSGGTNVVSSPKNSKKQPATYAPSIMSLDYVDSGSAGKHEGVPMYGYGCAVTSQGDLLFPDCYSSRGSFRNTPVAFKRQFSTRSDTGVVIKTPKDSKQPSKLTLASSHDNINSRPLKESLPNSKNSDNQMHFTSMPDVKYTSQENDGQVDSVRISPPEDEGKQEVTSSNACCRCLRFIIDSKMIQLMRYPNVRNSVLIYTIMSFGSIGFDDVFTVFASTDRKFSGLDFSSEKIGAALGLSSAPLLILQIFLFAKLEARIGARKVFMIFCIILMANCIAIPSLRILRDNTVPFWALLLTLMALNKIAQTTCFSANSLHINNSVPANFAGSVNGLAMTYTAIGRTLAPTLGGSIYAWSIVHGVKIGFPFDVNLIFIIFSFTYLISNIMCARLPESLNRQRFKERESLQGHDADDK